MLLSQKIEMAICGDHSVLSAIGQFLLHHQSRIERYSLREIAEQTYTSQASLVRFAKKMGYSGWKEFVRDFVAEARYFESTVSEVDFNFPFQSGDSSLMIAKKVAQVRREANRDTLAMMQEDTLWRAIRILRHSQRILLCSSSINISLAQLFQHKMLRIGVIVESIGLEEQAFMSFALNDKDCAIMISYSGNSESRVPTSLIPFLKERHIPIIGITSMGDNLIRQHADCTFNISSRENLYNKIASYATEESISVILDVLYSCYFAEDHDNHLQYKLSVSQHIEQRRIASSDRKE